FDFLTEQEPEPEEKSANTKSDPGDDLRGNAEKKYDDAGKESMTSGKVDQLVERAAETEEQFAVSAGRCTKGAFMQLVKVSEEMKTELKFDYVLVVDTEGLRALELAGNTTLNHDNELATFVVGLGNMTLINIFGENPADMQDVLQIVVQAFMRMKKNVTDISATEKNMDGKRRLQEKLDQMAQLAAKEEVCDVECFSDRQKEMK
ncbi:hypothetical protein INR49_025744, partial [Caranx melampygus]